MDTNMYGYIRVSTKEQNETRQVVAMREFGIEECDMVIEKQSGKDFRRPEYRRLIKKMKAGDVLVVMSIDRLGRNYNEILEQWRYLTKTKGCGIVVLDMPLLDTRRGKDLTGELIADIVLQLLSYVAQVERDNIRKRQREGIDAAKAKNVRFGRPPLPVPVAFQNTYEQWRGKTISASRAAKCLGVSRGTFTKWAQQQENGSYDPKDHG